MYFEQSRREKDFVNYFGFWSFKFFAASQILFVNLKEILKWVCKCWFVNKCQNTNTKITASRAYCCTKINTFLVWKPVDCVCVCVYIYIYIYPRLSHTKDSKNGTWCLLA